MNAYRFDCDAWIRVWALAETEEEARALVLEKLHRLTMPDVKVEWDGLTLISIRPPASPRPSPSPRLPPAEVV